MIVSGVGTGLPGGPTLPSRALASRAYLPADSSTRPPLQGCD